MKYILALMNRSCSNAPFSAGGQREILTSLFLRKAWPPIECLYLVAAKNDEALARIVHRFPPCRETPKWRNSGAFRRTASLFATVTNPMSFGYRRASTEDQNLDIQHQKLKQAGAGLKSLSEPWADTTSPAGRMVLTVFAGLTEFERELIRERTGAGGLAAMKRGFGLADPQSSIPRRPALAAARSRKSLNPHRTTLCRATASQTASFGGMIPLPGFSVVE
jgi:hypothetical protein